MVQLLKDESLVAKWLSFFEEHYKSKFETLSLSFPEKRSLYVDYDVLDRYDTDLSELLRENPYKAIFNAEEAVRQIDTTVGSVNPHFRIVKLPEICRKNIRELRSEHAGTLVSVEGLIKRHTPVKAKTIVGAFQCQKCGVIIQVEQSEDILMEPSECYKDQGGCERVSTFKFLFNMSKFIDAEKLELQENPEGLKGSEQPQTITVYLEDDVTGKVYPGDRVHINGILRAMQKRRGRDILSTFDFAIDAVSVEVKQSAYEDIEITGEDEKKILEVSKSPTLQEDMIQSIAPTIYGMDAIKKTLLLQLFGGVRKITGDGTRIRGDIHLLLVGDPGTAKSQLLAYMHNLAPRAILTEGGGSTKAGLTATAVKDDFSEGQWVLEAGALVLADQGLACVDEFDKMNENDRGSMHQAMEQQQISIAKAGINVTLKSRCSVLACANPKLGRFDLILPIHQQINMKPTLLSRFDVIFPVLDKPNTTKDMEMADHILKTHQNPDGKHIEPIYEPNFIRKYVAYAKQNVKPRLTDDAIRTIKKFYVDWRNHAENDGTIPFTPRQLEAFIRLAEAAARVRLSKEVTTEDVQHGLDLFLKYMNQLGIDRETGKFDIEKIATGYTHSQHTRMKTVLNIISTLDGDTSPENVIAECEIKGINSSKTESALERLEYDKQISLIKGVYKINA
jgi:replicative DNA helicase Mcm